MHSASWAPLVAVLVATGCKNTEPGPSSTTGRPVAMPPARSADARAVEWPALDCAAVLTVDDIHERCGRRPSVAFTVQAERDLVELPPPNKRHQITCHRRLILDPQGRHVVEFRIVGFGTIEDSDTQLALLRTAGREPEASFSTDRFARHDLGGAKGRLHFDLFETIPTGRQPLCDLRGLRALVGLLEERLPPR